MHSATEQAASSVSQIHPDHDAYQDHVLNKREFEDLDLGPPVEIHSRDQYRTHVSRVVESPNTECFTAFSTEQTSRQADIYYHRPTNTAVIIPKDLSQPATAFRPLTKQAYFNKRLADAQRTETSITIEPKRGGIHALDPEESEGAWHSSSDLTPEEKRGLRESIRKRASEGGDLPIKKK